VVTEKKQRFCVYTCMYFSLHQHAVTVLITIHMTWQLKGTVVRILRQKIENSACITCKFDALLQRILHRFYALFEANFSTSKLVALLYDPVCHTSILA